MIAHLDTAPTMTPAATRTHAIAQHARTAMIMRDTDRTEQLRAALHQAIARIRAVGPFEIACPVHGFDYEDVLAGLTEMLPVPQRQVVSYLVEQSEDVV